MCKFMHENWFHFMSLKWRFLFLVRLSYCIFIRICRHRKSKLSWFLKPFKTLLQPWNVGNGPLVFLTEMKLKCGRRLYNCTKPAKAHVLRPGFLKMNCVEQIYTCLCAVFLWLKMCTKSVKLCDIIQVLQNAAEKPDCFETILFFTF